MESQAMRVDGNAVAGTLGEIFVDDMTIARIACGGCGKIEPIGAEFAYIQAPGVVLRCRHCEDVLLVLTRTKREPRPRDRRGEVARSIPIALSVPSSPVKRSGVRSDGCLGNEPTMPRSNEPSALGIAGFRVMRRHVRT